MRYLSAALLVIVSMVAHAAPQAVGGGVLGNGAVGGQPAALGGGRPPAGDPCKEGAAFYNFDATLVSGVDGVQETSWTNAGTGGTPWDLDTAIAGGLTYQQAGDCNGSTLPCLVTDAAGTYRLSMGADEAKTWTDEYHCAIYFAPSQSTSRIIQFGNHVSRNMVYQVSPGILASYLGAGVGNSTTAPTRNLHAVCVNLTDPAATYISADGNAQAGPVDETGGSYATTRRLTAGGAATGANGCPDCEIHQLIGWDADPGLTIEEMSACLLSKWAPPVDPCLVDASLDYDSHTLPPGALSAWANDGTLGAGWDLTQPIPADQPTVSASCNGASSGNCVNMVDTTDFIYQASVGSATWASPFVCSFVYYDGIGTDYQVSWNNAADNYFGMDVSLNYFYRGTASSLSNGTTSAGWHSMCLDLSDASSVPLWVDGVLTNAGADLTAVADPTRAIFGALTTAGSLDAAGTSYGRVMFWQDTPSCTASELDTALRAQRGL